MALIRINHFYKSAGVPGDVIDVSDEEASLILSRNGGTLVAGEAATDAPPAGNASNEEGGSADDGETTPIDRLDISKRNLGLLKAAGVETVEQYQAMEDPAAIKGIGHAAVNEIGAAIEALTASDDPSQDDDDEPTDKAAGEADANG